MDVPPVETPASPFVGAPPGEPEAASGLISGPADTGVSLLPAGPLLLPALGEPVAQQAARGAGPATGAPVPTAAAEGPVIPALPGGNFDIAPAGTHGPLLPARAADPAFGQALKLMDDLAGVKAAMAMLEAGRAPGVAPPAPSGPGSGRQDPAPAPSPEAPPFAGGAPSGAAGPAPSGGGSAALYALMFALAAAVLGLWGRLELVPVRWRSVAVVALVERPG